MPTDHRTDIRAYAHETEQELRALLALHRADGEIGRETLSRLVDLGLDEDYNESPYLYGGDVAYDLASSYLLDVEHSDYYSPHRSGGFTRDPEETRLIFAFGGPTVRVTYSHRHDTAELFHSWGREPMPYAAHERDPDRPSGLRGVAGTETGNPADCADRTTWPMDLEVVREFVETFAPHPLGGV